jgi:DNA-binding transcriptional regulator YiaG
MSPEEFDKALHTLRLGQRAFAHIIKRNERTVRDWKQGRAKVPGEIAILLRVWIKHNENPLDWLESN